MRLAPDDHPLQPYLSHWNDARDARSTWRWICRYAGRALAKGIEGLGLWSRANFCWKFPGSPHYAYNPPRLDVTYFPKRGWVGWVNFATRKCHPTVEFGDAPLICTLSFHCDPPPLTRKQFEFFRSKNGPLYHHDHWGVFLCPRQGYRLRGRVVTGKEGMGILTHPRAALRLHVHHSESEAWARQGVLWIAGWLRGEPGPLKAIPPEPRPGTLYRDPPPEEFYSPLALDVLSGWYDLLRNASPDDFARAVRRRLLYGRKSRAMAAKRKMGGEAT